MIDQFSDWVKSKQAEIDHVGKLLSAQLSTEPTELIEEATEIEAWGSRVGELLATVEGYLTRGKLFYLPSDTSLRESERKAIMDDKVADIRKMRDILESYKDCIEKRISLVQSILRYEKPHVAPEVKGYRGYGSAAEIMRNQ